MFWVILLGGQLAIAGLILLFFGVQSWTASAIGVTCTFWGFGVCVIDYLRR